MPLYTVKKGFFSVLRQKRVTTVAGAWVFFITLSLIPIIALLVLSFSLLGIDVTAKLLPYFPIEVKSTIEEFFTLAQDGLKGLTLFFVVSAILSGSALLNQMKKDGDFIYGEQREEGTFRRVKALFALFILFIVFSFSALLVAFSDALFLRIKQTAISIMFAKISLPLIIVGVSFIIIVLLNKFISPVKLDAKSLLLGSIVSLVIIVIGTLGFSIYMKYFKAKNALSLGIVSVLAFLTWLYILALGLIVGATIVAYLRKKTL